MHASHLLLTKNACSLARAAALHPNGLTTLLKPLMPISAAQQALGAWHISPAKLKMSIPDSVWDVLQLMRARAWFPCLDAHAATCPFSLQVCCCLPAFQDQTSFFVNFCKISILFSRA